MRLDNTTVQSGNSSSLVIPRVCVCEPHPNEPARVTQPEPVPLCPTCGGSRSQDSEASRPERQGRRKLQDFLGGFV